MQGRGRTTRDERQVGPVDHHVGHSQDRHRDLVGANRDAVARIVDGGNRQSIHAGLVGLQVVAPRDRRFRPICGGERSARGQLGADLSRRRAHGHEHALDVPAVQHRPGQHRQRGRAEGEGQRGRRLRQGQHRRDVVHEEGEGQRPGPIAQEVKGIQHQCLRQTVRRLGQGHGVGPARAAVYGDALTLQTELSVVVGPTLAVGRAYAERPHPGRILAVKGTQGGGRVARVVVVGGARVVTGAIGRQRYRRAVIPAHVQIAAARAARRAQRHPRSSR